VGLPSVSKIALYLDTGDRVLSDCVLAVPCKTTADARALYAALRAEHGKLRRLYSGTCAKYTTVERVARFIGRLPWAESRRLRGERRAG
jgi:hypothetical protein